MHDALSTVIKVDTILGAAFFSNAQLNALRGEMNATRSELNGRMNSL